MEPLQVGRGQQPGVHRPQGAPHGAATRRPPPGGVPRAVRDPPSPSVTTAALKHTTAMAMEMATIMVAMTMVLMAKDADSDEGSVGDPHGDAHV